MSPHALGVRLGQRVIRTSQLHGISRVHGKALSKSVPPTRSVMSRGENLAYFADPRYGQLTTMTGSDIFRSQPNILPDRRDASDNDDEITADQAVLSIFAPIFFPDTTKYITIRYTGAGGGGMGL